MLLFDQNCCRITAIFSMNLSSRHGSTIKAQVEGQFTWIRQEINQSHHTRPLDEKILEYAVEKFDGVCTDRSKVCRSILNSIVKDCIRLEPYSLGRAQVNCIISFDDEISEREQRQISLLPTHSRVYITAFGASTRDSKVARQTFTDSFLICRNISNSTASLRHLNHQLGSKTGMIYPEWFPCARINCGVYSQSPIDSATPNSLACNDSIV